jgi:PEP-CTERM motif
VKKLVAVTVLGVALAVPLTSASANMRDWGSFCTTGLALNFCGSVEVSVVTISGSTNVVITVLNASGGVNGGDSRAVFTAIGLDNIGMSNSTPFSAVSIVMNGTNYSGWQIDANKTIGGGVNVDLLPHTDNGIQNGISSACGPANKRIATGGIGGCSGGSHTVAISFNIGSTFDLDDARLFIKAQGFNSSECIIGSACAPIQPPVTPVPEPATLTLFGAGVLALSGRISRWRRRREKG